jgi:hypothetical protein
MQKIVKWIVRIIGGFLILFILAGVISWGISFFNKPVATPPTDKAPWAIQTYSNDSMRIADRIYFAAEVGQDGDTPTITGYWSFNGKSYDYHRGVKEFPVADYGSIDIRRRTP